MKLVYLSLTGNVRNFVKRTGLNGLELNYSNPFVEIGESYIAIVPSYNDDITEFFQDFIDFKDNNSNLKGIAGSGSLNFNEEYCFNAKVLSTIYIKPLIFTFEFSGTDEDIVNFKREVKKVEVT